jgi:hypothetical protein
MNKSINKRLLRQDVRTSDGATYEYELTVATSTRVASYKIPLYSVKVRLTLDGKVTEASLDDAFADVGKATVLYEMLVKNLVTPIDLPYVLEDRISV